MIPINREVLQIRSLASKLLKVIDLTRVIAVTRGLAELVVETLLRSKDGNGMSKIPISNSQFRPRSTRQVPGSTPLPAAFHAYLGVKWYNPTAALGVSEGIVVIGRDEQDSKKRPGS